MIAEKMLGADDLLAGCLPAERLGRLGVIQEAMTWIGTPYHHEGRIRGAGVDCGMFLLEVFEAEGLIPHIDPAPYPHDWHLHKSAEIYLGHVLEHCQKVETPLPGDVALFKYGRCLSHGGIMLDGRSMIHSYFGRGVVIDDLDTSETLGKRLAGFFSIWRR